MITLQNANYVYPQNYDEVWIITRSIKQLSDNVRTAPNYRYVPDLAPSPDLFNQARQWIMCHTLNDEWDRYVQIFLTDLTQNAQAVQALNELYYSSFTKNIALCCFCTDEAHCHRSIIAGLLLNAGAHITCNMEYMRYQYPKKKGFGI